MSRAVSAWDLPLILRARLTVWGAVAAASCASCADARVGMPVATPAPRIPAALTKVRREISISAGVGVCSRSSSSEVQSGVLIGSLSRVGSYRTAFR